MISCFDRHERIAVLLCTVTVLASRHSGAQESLEQAHELLNAWQLEAARAAAASLFVEQPDDPRVWLLAARVQHQRGEHASAMALLEAAEREGTASEYLDELKNRVAASTDYAAHFATRETAHFKIRYLNKDEIVAVYAEPVLEAAYANVGRELDFYAAEKDEKIVVEIYPDARGLAGATGLTIKEIETSGTIAVCKFHRLMVISPLATAAGYSWADTMAHEFTHLVISKKSRNTIPIWLHEGIAKYYESLWYGPIGQALSPYSEKLLADAVRKGKYITFEQMHPSMAKLPSQDDAALAFAEVFTVIEFLHETYGKQTVPQVLSLTAQGSTVEQALERTYRLPFRAIERRWKRYLRQRKFREVAGAQPQRIVLASEPDSAQAGAGEKPLEEIAETEVHDFARLGELLQLRGHHAAAVVEYEKAYERSGVRYGTLVNRLARAYAATQRQGDALKVLERSLAAHPSDGDAHLLAGRLRLQRKEMAAAKRHFEAVRLQNPFNPEVHMALAALYEQAGDTAGATTERRLLALAGKPRPTRIYERKPPLAGEARVSIVTAVWGPAHIDGTLEVQTPAWEIPVSAGEHTIEYPVAGGETAASTMTIRPGESKLLVLH